MVSPGSYDHSAVYSLLELEKLVAPGARVMDVGTGSGILAMAAARLGAGSVLALDTDPAAVKTAQANIRANGLHDLIQVENHSLSPDDQDTAGGFDLVVANLYTKVVLEIARELAAPLVSRGHLVVSGIMAERASEVRSRLDEAGCIPIRVTRDGDWVVIVCAKAVE